MLRNALRIVSLTAAFAVLCAVGFGSSPQSYRKLDATYGSLAMGGVGGKGESVVLARVIDSHEVTFATPVLKRFFVRRGGKTYEEEIVPMWPRAPHVWGKLEVVELLDGPPVPRYLLVDTDHWIWDPSHGVKMDGSMMDDRLNGICQHKKWLLTVYFARLKLTGPETASFEPPDWEDTTPLADWNDSRVSLYREYAAIAADPSRDETMNLLGGRLLDRAFDEDERICCLQTMEDIVVRSGDLKESAECNELLRHYVLLCLEDPGLPWQLRFDLSSDVQIDMNMAANGDRDNLLLLSYFNDVIGSTSNLELLNIAASRILEAQSYQDADTIYDFPEGMANLEWRLNRKDETVSLLDSEILGWYVNLRTGRGNTIRGRQELAWTLRWPLRTVSLTEVDGTADALKLQRVASLHISEN